MFLLIKKKIKKTKVKVFPNPTKGIINVDFDNSEPKNIFLVDNLGKKVSTLEYGDNSNGHIKLDISSLLQGTYFLVIDKHTYKIIRN